MDLLRQFKPGSESLDDRVTDEFWRGRAIPFIRLEEFERRWRAIPDPEGIFRDESDQRLRVEPLEEVSKGAVDVYDYDVEVFAQVVNLSSCDLMRQCSILHGAHSPVLIWSSLLEFFLSFCPSALRSRISKRLLCLRTEPNEKLVSSVEHPKDVFRYPPLPSNDRHAIRLVVLHPSQASHGVVECTLSLASLQESPDYEALSYVWGDGTKQCPIKMNGKWFSVTENLETALRHLRYHDQQKRAIWIDALCINQADIPERNQQVRRMHTIYQNARKVLIWLGPESNASTDVFDFLDLISQIETRNDCPINACLPSMAYLLGRIPVEQIGELFKRPYWRRTWVIPEIVHAFYIEVICGRRSTDWHMLMKLVLALEMKLLAECQGGIPEPGKVLSALASGGPILLIKELRKDETPRRSLLQLLHHTCMNQVSDPRDKLFALHSLLADNSEDKRFVPDYSMNTAQTFIAFTKHLIESSGHLNILSYSGMEASATKMRTFDLPSWVPDFQSSWVPGSQSTLGDSVASLGGPFNSVQDILRIYKASLDLAPSGHSFSHQSQVLHVQGIVVDKITKFRLWDSLTRLEEEQLQLRSNQGDEIEDRGTRVSKRLKELKRSFAPEPGASGPYSTKSWTEVFWRTILADRELITVVDREMKPSLKSQRLGTRLLGDPFPPNNADEEARMYSKLLENQALLSSHTTSHLYRMRYFSQSEKGYHGLFSTQVVEGDIIVVLPGACVPFILRPSWKSYSGYYTLMGAT